MIKNRIRVKERFVLDKKKAGLLIIDVQNHFANSAGRTYLPASKAAVHNMLKITSWSSNVGLPIILTQHCHNDASDRGMMSKFYSDHIKEGEWDSGIIDELKGAKAFEIIKKSTYDAFWNTKLQELLLSLNIEQLIICGCLTHLCCESTARSAFVRGFEVYFISDSTFSSTQELHDGSLRSIANGFGLVLTTQELLSCL